MTEWYYAKDGQQNGPVTFDDLKHLAASGGLSAQKDMVWKSSMPDWLPSGEIQGLFIPSAAPDVPAANPSNPYAAPQSDVSGPVSSGGGLAEIIPGSEPIDAVACVKRGFELTKRHFGILVLVGLTYIGVSIGAALVLGVVDSALGLGGTTQTEWQQPGAGSGFTYQQEGSVFSGIISNVLSIFLALGLCRVGLNLASGKEVSVGMLFGEGRKLLRGIGASILFGLMIAIGFILLIVPGIYLMLRYGQFMYAIVDKDMGVMESLSYSSSITTNNRMNLFVLALLSLVIFIAGVLALVVGLIFAYPLVLMSWVVAYRWMQYGHRAAMDEPGTQTPVLAAA